jgi:hypothetical protein
MGVQSYRDLGAWQKSMDMVEAGCAVDSYAACADDLPPTAY